MFQNRLKIAEDMAKRRKTKKTKSRAVIGRPPELPLGNP